MLAHPGDVTAASSKSGAAANVAFEGGKDEPGEDTGDTEEEDDDDEEGACFARLRAGALLDFFGVAWSHSFSTGDLRRPSIPASSSWSMKPTAISREAL